MLRRQRAAAPGPVVAATTPAHRRGEVVALSSVRAFAMMRAVTYFGPLMVNRQRLLWTIATRRQLERWEPFVAEAVRRGLASGQLDSADVWSAEVERHFALVAARNLLHALDLEPPSNVAINPTMRAELKEGRDLVEHWPDNLPVFNVTPRRQEPPYPSGKAFAARNPRDGPYNWLSWSSKVGAKLLPNVSAPALHGLLDAVEAEVLASDPDLTQFVLPRAPSPWHHESGEWSPKPAT